MTQNMILVATSAHTCSATTHSFINIYLRSPTTATNWGAKKIKRIWQLMAMHGSFHYSLTKLFEFKITTFNRKIMSMTLTFRWQNFKLNFYDLDIDNKFSLLRNFSKTHGVRCQFRLIWLPRSLDAIYLPPSWLFLLPRCAANELQKFETA